MCAHQCAHSPSISINLFARANKLILCSNAPCFLAEPFGAKSTSHGDNLGPPVRTICIVVKHWRALLSHKKCIRNHLRKSKIPKIFWGGMPSDPPSWRASRVWEPDQPRMASVGPVLKLPLLQTLSLVVYKRVSGYNFFRARYIIIH